MTNFVSKLLESWPASTPQDLVDKLNGTRTLESALREFKVSRGDTPAQSAAELAARIGGKVLREVKVGPGDRRRPAASLEEYVARVS